MLIIIVVLLIILATVIVYPNSQKQVRKSLKVIGVILQIGAAVLFIALVWNYLNISYFWSRLSKHPWYIAGCVLVILISFQIYNSEWNQRALKKKWQKDKGRRSENK